RSGGQGKPKGNHKWDRHRSSRDVFEEQAAHCGLGLIDEARKHDHLRAGKLGLPERAELSRRDAKDLTRIIGRRKPAPQPLPVCHVMAPSRGRCFYACVRGRLGWYLEWQDGSGPSASSQLFIETNILGSHPFGREALFKSLPHCLTVQT